MATIGRGVSELGTRISELRGCAVGVAVALVLVAAGSTDARRITLKMGCLFSSQDSEYGFLVGFIGINLRNGRTRGKHRARRTIWFCHRPDLLLE